MQHADLTRLDLVDGETYQLWIFSAQRVRFRTNLALPETTEPMTITAQFD